MIIKVQSDTVVMVFAIADHGFISQPLRIRLQLWASRSHTVASVTKQYNFVPA